MSFNVEDCFNKLKEDDSDKRFVGAQDLVNALTKKQGKEPIKLDSAAETKLVDKLLDMVALDTSSGVRSLAVKALGLITKTAQESNLKNMVEKLPAHLEKEKHNVKGQEITGEVRESVANCLKGVIDSVPDTQASIIDACKEKLAPRLVALAKKTKEGDLISRVLDVLAELLGKWGAHLSKKDGLLGDIQKISFPQLKSNIWACRNRASACLASASVYSSDELFNDLVQQLSKALADVEAKPEHTLSYAQAITAVSRTVGARFGPHLEHFVSTLVAIVQDPAYDEENGEVRVASLQCFEAFLVRCPKHVDAHLDQIEELALGYMTYDPNFVEEEEVPDDDNAMVDDESNDADDGFGGDGDGGGCPWKPAAAHLLAEVIASRPDRLDHVYDYVIDGLIKAFKEDDDAVRLEIFNTFSAALRQTEIVTGGDPGASASKKLREFTPNFVKALVKELKGKSLKTRPAAFKLLSLFVKVLPGSIGTHLAELAPGLKAALTGKATNSALKAEALAFLGSLLSTHDSKSVQGILGDLAPAVYAAFKDPSPPTATAALNAAAALSRAAPDSVDVATLYKATLDRLGDRDVHVDIQEAVIDTAASLIATSGDKLGADQVGKALTILSQRLGNDLTRLAAVNAFATISQSSKSINCSAVIGDVFAHVVKFIPLENRQLKVAALNALPALVDKYGKEKTAAAHFEKIVLALAGILPDSSFVGFAVKGIAQILASDSKVAVTVKEHVLPKVQELLQQKPAVQGFALDAVMELYQRMAASNSKDLSSEKLLTGLSDIGSTPNLEHQAYKGVAQCVGALASAGDSSAIVKKFLGELGGKSKEHVQFSLYCIGEVGKRVDLSGNAAVKDKVLAAFESGEPDIRAAAAISLGSVAAGNLEKYLPEIIAEMKTPAKQTLLLSSLREAIVATKPERIASFSDKLLDILFKHTGAEQEATRAVVAESLGKLAVTNPQKVIVALAEKAQDTSAATRATVAASIRSALSNSNDLRQSASQDSIWSKHIASFLTLIADAEVPVRKEALLSLDFVARVKPKLLRPHLATVLPNLYKQTVIIASLIVEQVVGPFKIITDHGLPYRQAAYGAMHQLLDTCLDALDLPAFIEPLNSGLAEDDGDVKMLCYLILIKLSAKAPNALVAGLEKIVPPLKKNGVLSQPKDAKFAADIETNNQIVNAALRCVGILSKSIPDLGASPLWKDLMASIAAGKLLDKPLQEAYERVLKTLD